jgi:hypothetical protein
MKQRKRKTKRPKSQSAPKVARRRNPIAVATNEKNRQLQQRLSEALDQQKATSEVLRIISSSPGKLAPVFDAILSNATRICEAKFANLWLHDGMDFRAAAVHGAPPAYRELLQDHIKLRPGPGTARRSHRNKAACTDDGSFHFGRVSEGRSGCRSQR